MNLFILFSIFSAISAYEVKWYNITPIDHFSFRDQRMFNLRYTVDKQHWTKNGPIIFGAGCEGDITSFANGWGWLYTLSREFNAMVLFVEHRYYGESLPFGKDSFTSIENLGYCTSEQALADYANVVQHVKSEEKSPDSKVVVFGGSYCGALAAWLRTKYPQVVVGAVAAAAPVQGYYGLNPNNYAYYSVVTRTFRLSGKDCDLKVKSSWPALRRLLKTDDGRKWINKQFNFCQNSQVTEENEGDALVAWIKTATASLAIFDYPYAAVLGHPWPCKVACSQLADISASDNDKITGLAKISHIGYNSSGDLPCYSFKNSVLPMGNAWAFQTCSEQFMVADTNGKTDMYEPHVGWGQDIIDIANYCKKKYFGVGIRPYRISRIYGDACWKSATNIVYSNGYLDPTIAWSITEIPVDNPSIKTVIMNNSAHGFEFFIPMPTDPKEVIEGRKQIKYYMSQWLNNGHDTTKVATTTHKNGAFLIQVPFIFVFVAILQILLVW